MYYLRDIEERDLDGLFAVAGHLDTVNLPEDREVLARLIALSQRSFAGEVEPLKRQYIFALFEIARGGERGGADRQFTGMSYQEADHISQTNKEFIRTLFPSEPIYACLLPRAVQDLIGVVGPETRGVEKMLRRVGFEFAGRIDPFDGGPHFIADTDEISLVKATRRLTVAAVDLPDGAVAPLGPVCV